MRCIARFINLLEGYLLHVVIFLKKSALSLLMLLTVIFNSNLLEKKINNVCSA